jgi:hypothetical protein
MDLRGFSPESSGCIYEIGQLINIIPTSRFLLVTDESTDWPFLEQVLHSSWQQMEAASPNRSPGVGKLRVHQILDESPDEIQRLMGSLCESQPR